MNSEATISHDDPISLHIKAEKVIGLPYFRVIVQEDVRRFQGRVLEFPELSVFGASKEEAESKLDTLFRKWVMGGLAIEGSVQSPFMDRMSIPGVIPCDCGGQSLVETATWEPMKIADKQMWLHRIPRYVCTKCNAISYSVPLVQYIENSLGEAYAK